MSFLDNILGKTKQGVGSFSISPGWEEALMTIPLLLGAYEQGRPGGGPAIGNLLTMAGGLLGQHADYRKQLANVAGQRQMIQSLINQKTSPEAYRQLQALGPNFDTLDPTSQAAQLSNIQSLGQQEALTQERYRKPIEFYNRDTTAFEFHQPEDFPGGKIPPNLLPWQTGQQIKNAQLVDKNKPFSYGDEFNQLLATNGFKTPGDWLAYQTAHPQEAKQLAGLIRNKIRQERIDAQRISIYEHNHDKPLSGKDSYDMINAKGEHLPPGVFTQDQAAAMGFRYVNDADQNSLRVTKLGLDDLRDTEQGLSLLAKSRPKSFTNTKLAELRGDPIYQKLLSSQSAMLAAAQEYTKTLRININEFNSFKNLAIKDSDTVQSAQEKIFEMKRRMYRFVSTLGIDPASIDQPIPNLPADKAFDKGISDVDKFLDSIGKPK